MPKTPIAAIFVSAGVKVDGGGFWIDGQGHIHRIGPWSPDAQKDLDTAASLFAHAQGVANREIRAQIQDAALRLVSAHSGEVQKAVGQAVQVGA